MMPDAEGQTPRSFVEAEAPSPPEPASVAAPPEQTGAAAAHPGSARTAVRLTRRGLIGSIAGAVGALVLGGVGHLRSAEGQIPSYPVPEDPTKVPGRPSSPYGFRSQFENAGSY